MKFNLAIASLLIAASAGSSLKAATTITVPATGDLYLAGQAAGSSCCFEDSLPAESPVLAPVTLAGSQYLTFTATGGATNQPGPVYATPDGNTSSIYDLHADYGTGISGPTNVHLAGLAGVFLGADTPSGTAPPQLTGTDFSSISPGLDQIFYIGDGLTGKGSGSTQSFFLPAGAERLFLGVIDDGGYYDNSGSITATITSHAASVVGAVPEPATWAMMILGMAIIGFAMRRRQKLATQAWYAH